MTVIDWAALKTTDFARLAPAATLAVLPVAAVEQHGPHLPSGTDALILEGLLARLRQRGLRAGNTALVLPLQAVGLSPEHTAFPGTLTSSAETLLSLWVDLGRSVQRAGLQHLVILNSHGGNSPLLDLAALRLRHEAGLTVVSITTHRLGTPEGLIEPSEIRYGVHGGQIETALMLALAPHLVDQPAMADFTSSEPQISALHPQLGAAGSPARMAWMAEDLNPAGAIGNAALATAHQGEAILAHLTERLASLLEASLHLPHPRPS
ncbi:MAG: creatininase family protein [Geminicoccaceae bacterium]|nr:MAG: creatininase family protein [Geminicoccaceae bacterium]